MQSSNYYQPQQYMIRPSSIVNNSAHTEGPEEDDSDGSGIPDKRSGRRKIKIEYITDKSRRHITFSKRKAGIMKKAYELSTLTGTQVLLLVVSETGLVYTFTTPKLQPLVTKPEGKNLIQSCLNAPDPLETTSAHPQDSRLPTNNASTTSPPTSNSSTSYYRPNQNLDTSSNNTYMDDRKNFGSMVPPSTNPSLVLNNSNDPQMPTNFNPMAYSSYNTSANTAPGSTNSSLYSYNMQGQPENDARFWNNNNNISNSNNAANSLRHDMSKR